MITVEKVRKVAETFRYLSAEYMDMSRVEMGVSSIKSIYQTETIGTHVEHRCGTVACHAGWYLVGSDYFKCSETAELSTGRCPDTGALVSLNFYTGKDVKLGKYRHLINGEAMTYTHGGHLMATDLGLKPCMNLNNGPMITLIFGVMSLEVVCLSAVSLSIQRQLAAYRLITSLIGGILWRTASRNRQVIQIKATDAKAKVVFAFIFEKGGFFTNTYMYNLVVWTVYLFLGGMWGDQPKIYLSMGFGALLGITALRFCDRTDYKDLIKSLHKLTEKE